MTTCPSLGRRHVLLTAFGSGPALKAHPVFFFIVRSSYSAVVSSLEVLICARLEMGLSWLKTGLTTDNR